MSFLLTVQLNVSQTCVEHEDYDQLKRPDLDIRPDYQVQLALPIRPRI